MRGQKHINPLTGLFQLQLERFVIEAYMVYGEELQSPYGAIPVATAESSQKQHVSDVISCNPLTGLFQLQR